MELLLLLVAFPWNHFIIILKSHLLLFPIHSQVPHQEAHQEDTILKMEICIDLICPMLTFAQVCQ